MAVQPQQEPPSGERRRTLGDREGVLAWLFLAPAVVYIVLLVAIPFLLAIAFYAGAPGAVAERGSCRLRL